RRRHPAICVAEFQRSFCLRLRSSAWQSVRPPWRHRRIISSDTMPQSVTPSRWSRLFFRYPAQSSSTLGDGRCSSKWTTPTCHSQGTSGRLLGPIPETAKLDRAHHEKQAVPFRPVDCEFAITIRDLLKSFEEFAEEVPNALQR